MTDRDALRRIVALVLLTGWSIALPPAPAGSQTKPTIRFIIPGAPTPRVTMAIPLPSPVDVPSHWWNRVQMIAALQLTPEQRQQMDTTIAGFEKRIAALQLEQNAARQRFEVAVKTSDWEGAEKAAGDWEQALAKGWGLQHRAKIDVSRHLTAEQRDQLWRRYPQALEYPWTAARGLPDTF